MEYWLKLETADTRNLYESLSSVRRGIYVILTSTARKNNALFANQRGACLYGCADNNYKIWYRALLASVLPILKLQFIIVVWPQLMKQELLPFSSG